MRAAWLRHQQTWFLGLDTLPNEKRRLDNWRRCANPTWENLVGLPTAWHKAQLSVVYEGYPKQDAHESEAKHCFRINRAAAHVDGILLEEACRYLRESHRFILGFLLRKSRVSLLLVWPESHVLMRDVLRECSEICRFNRRLQNSLGCCFCANRTC